MHLRSLGPALLFSLAITGSAYAQSSSPSLILSGANAFKAPINCTIQPSQIVNVSSQMRGIAAEVLVRAGETVKKGDPLIQLDRDVAKTDMQLAKARAEADSSLKAAVIQRDALVKKEARLAKALAQKAVSQANYEQTALDLALAENAIERERRMLEIAKLEYERTRVVFEKSVIKSPVDGVIAKGLIDPGESVNDQPVATIIVNEPLVVEAFVPQAMTSRLAQQSDFSIFIDGADKTAVPVSLDHISQVADLTSNTVSFFFDLSKSGVLPGSKCTLETPSV